MKRENARAKANKLSSLEDAVCYTMAKPHIMP